MSYRRFRYQNMIRGTNPPMVVSLLEVSKIIVLDHGVDISRKDQNPMIILEYGLRSKRESSLKEVNCKYINIQAKC